MVLSQSEKRLNEPDCEAVNNFKPNLVSVLDVLAQTTGNIECYSLIAT